MSKPFPFLFTLGILILGVTLFIFTPHVDRSEYIKSLGSMQRVEFTEKVTIAHLLLRLRDYLDVKINEIALNGLNPEENLKLGVETLQGWMEKEKQRFRSKGISLDADCKVTLRELTGHKLADEKYNKVILSGTIGSREIDRGAVFVGIQLNLHIKDKHGNSNLNHNVKMSVTHPVRIFLLYRILKALKNLKINFSWTNLTSNLTTNELKDKVASLMDREIIEILENVTGIDSSSKLLSKLKILLEINKTINVYTYNLTDENGVEKEYVEINVFLSGFVMDVKGDSFVFIGGELKRVKMDLELYFHLGPFEKGF